MIMISSSLFLQQKQPAYMVSTLRPLDAAMKRRNIGITILLSVVSSVLITVMAMTMPSTSAFVLLPVQHDGKHPVQNRLFVLSSDSQSPSSRVSSTDKPPRVVYQKVVRPPPRNGKSDRALFLPTLVQYLQDDFKLPTNLPMVYETTIGENDGSNGKDYAILQWDSPLSPLATETCLSLQVVAVQADNNSRDTQMAMIVVTKQASADTNTSTMPPLLQNLFADSERQILQALDRGLDDYYSGKYAATTSRKSDSLDDKNSNQQEDPVQAMWSEIVTDDELAAENGDQREGETALRQSSNVLDAEIVTNDNKTAPPSNEPITSESADFAVEAARKIAEKRKTQKGSTTDDFAVQAAKKVAMNRAAKHKSGQHRNDEINNIGVSPIENDGSEISETSVTPRDPELANVLNQRPPSLDAHKRAFVQTISTPADYHRRRKKTSYANVKKTLEGQAPTSSRHSPSPENQNAKPRKLNLNVRKDEKEPSMTIAGDDADDITGDDLKKQIQIAQETLEEIAKQGKELTPEELLADVLKFEDKTQSDSGFVSGAFEKAKELLKDQKRRRDDRLAQNIVDQVSVRVQNSGSQQSGVKELSPDEEIRRIFAAGERLADGRITTASSPQEASETLTCEIQEGDISDLLNAEKSISSYARILDEELAELEVRINKSPGEELDGPRPNPIFDIFSGPEVYNPNVDPETAVNWPGSGTTNARLPKELDEAVKQAKFAAEVVMNLKEEEGANNRHSRYFVGKRELFPIQVENIRAVVREAVEVGLIPDPLVRLEEASRLQMLVDELQNQPEDRLRAIAFNFKDLLLSENFVSLIKERLTRMADRDLEALRQDDDSLDAVHARERQILGQLVAYAQLLVKETRALGAELEAQQLEVIRSICKVAMDPSHKTDEEAAVALTDSVRDMRPLFDSAFVAYLKYAVAEEEGRLARAGILDDPQENRWLFVLKIVQQGVYKELERGISRYIDHIWYVLRMETPDERRMLLKKLLDVMPTMDVRPFVQVVDSIVGALGDSARGEFDGYMELGELTNKLLQLKKDVGQLLPKERIAAMSRDADEWATAQKEKLLEQRRVTKKRLEAARGTEHLDEEAEAFGRSGEVERFD